MNLNDIPENYQLVKASNKSRILLSKDAQNRQQILKELPSYLLPVYQQLHAVSSIHFPEIYQLKANSQHLYLTEEYIQGSTLAALMSKHAFTCPEAVSIGLQLCDAADILHRCTPPIIHRDLTPWNLMLTDSHILKIIDFDTARNYKPDAACDTHRLGTLEYAAPEQFGYSQTDERSDIYSIGVLLYELAHGKSFSRNNNPSTAPAFVSTAAHRRLDDIITRCTMFAPSQRYQSVQSLHHALLHALPLRYSYRLRKDYRPDLLFDMDS